MALVIWFNAIALVVKIMPKEKDIAEIPISEISKRETKLDSFLISIIRNAETNTPIKVAGNDDAIKFLKYIEDL